MIIDGYAKEPSLGYFGNKKKPCIILFDEKRLSLISKHNLDKLSCTMSVTIDLVKHNNELCFSFCLEHGTNDGELLVFPAIENYSFLKNIVDDYDGYIMLINGNINNGYRVVNNDIFLVELPSKKKLMFNINRIKGYLAGGKL